MKTRYSSKTISNAPGNAPVNFKKVPVFKAFQGKKNWTKHRHIVSMFSPVLEKDCCFDTMHSVLPDALLFATSFAFIMADEDHTFYFGLF